MTTQGIKWPRQVPAELNAFYGNPSGSNGRQSQTFVAKNCVNVTPPFKMVTAWDGKPVNRFLVNRKCADAMLLALEEIWNDAGRSQKVIEQKRMHLFGGCLNYRVMRGGSALSMHSWGCAIDLDPANNAFGSSRMSMPKDVVEAFKRQGAVWGGDWKKKDGMHFQFARI